MKRTLLTILITALLTCPVFASVESDIDNAIAEVKSSGDVILKEYISGSYPVGSVYITAEESTAEEVAELFNGEWRQIDYTFFWATDGSQDYLDQDEDGVIDGTNIEIDPLHKINSRGGKANYVLVAGISGGENISLWTDSEESYVAENVNVLLRGTASMVSEIVNAALVTEDGESMITIMPPYMVVRAFERVS